MFEDHDKRMTDFDRNFRAAQRLIVAGWLVSVVSGVGLLGFGIWVIVKLLAHFGVI